MKSLLQDVRYGLRMLRKSPGFTTVAVLTLALGIGANTAIFSILDSLILRDLPVPHPEQIVDIGAHAPRRHYASLSLPMFEEIARNQKVFSSMFAVTGYMANARPNGRFERVNMWAVTGDFYSTLGAVPEIGRLLDPSDVNLDAAFPQQVAVLGYGFWQRNYHGARDVIGKSLKIEDQSFTVIGVTRREFRGTEAEMEPEIVVPLNAEPLVTGETDLQKYLQRRNVLWLGASARLKTGVTIDQARAQMDSLWPGMLRDSMPSQSSPEERRILSSLQFSVESGARGDSILRSRFTRPVSVLLAISGMVLLIACMNLATLTLSRAAARSHEFGLRVALGATRRALARQMLTESLLLSVTGTVVGLAFAEWGNHALAAFIIEQLGYTARSAVDLSIDLRTLAFTASLAIFCGVIFGLAPVWSASREAPRLALQKGSRSLGRGTGRLGRTLIVTQVALSVVLFAGAGLFVRSLEKLRAAQPGFQIDGVLEVGLYPKPNGFKDLSDPVSYFHQLTDRVSHLPGVYSAAFEHYGIGSGYTFDQNVHIHGLDGNELSSDCERVMPGFFRTVGISLLRGRTFSWEDNRQSPHVVIVSQDFAQRAFPHQDAIGQRIDIPAEPKWQNLEVIGVVSNTSLHDVHEPLQPTLYIPTLQHDSRADYDILLVRTNLPPAAILGSTRQVVASFGRQNVSSVNSLSESVSRSLVTERIIAMLSSFFGALALLLAAIGLYGLMAYNVTQRTRELGIRFALGAARTGFFGETLRSDPPDFWLPLQQEILFDGQNAHMRTNQPQWLYVIGRLKPGASVQALPARLTPVLQRWLREEDEMPAEFKPQIEPTIPQKFIRLAPVGGGVTSLREGYGASLRILLMVCGTLLLIACANLANLLLARGAARRTQTAVRLALGAARTRVIRQQLTEAVLMSVLGGIAGLGIAYVGARLMLALAFHGATFTPISAAPSLPVLGFAFALSLLTGVLFGMVPAWLASRSNPAEALHGAGRGTRAGASLPQKALVVSQVALSLVLLTCAGLLTVSLRNLESQDFGFAVHNRISIEINPPLDSYTPEHLDALYPAIEDGLLRLPNVQSASLAGYSPLSGNNWGELIAVEGRGDPELTQAEVVSWDRVSRQYFSTVGQRIVRGRDFAESDSSASRPVAIVNESLVRKYFPNEDPIGKHFGMDMSRYSGTFEIVGVARDAKYNDPDQPAKPMFFVPLEQSVHYPDVLMQRGEIQSHFVSSIQLFVRGNTRNLEPQLRKALADIDPNLTIITVQSMNEQVASNFDQQRMVVQLAGTFGLIAMLLAAIGLYGLMAYTVACRTSEIGVRMALGADRLNIVRLVLRGAFLLVAIGLLIGIPLAIGAGRLMAAQLFEIRNCDPHVFGFSILALGACAAAASIFPAHRAASTDPLKALRTD